MSHIVVERPVHEVFAFASNPCCWREWIAGAAPVQHTWSGQLNVGTTFTQGAPLASFWDDTSWEVTEYQPPHVFACRWLGASCGAVRLLCEVLGGKTRVTVSTEAAAGLFVSGPDVEQAIQGQMQRDLGALKRLLEAGLMSTNTLGVWRPDRHAHDSQGLSESSSKPLSPSTKPSPGRLYVATTASFLMVSWQRA